jgi:hypothetical protein
MIALASLPPWNDLGSHAGVRPDYRNGGRAGVSAQEASGPATRHLRGRRSSGVRTCSGANGGLSESGGGACAAELDIQGFARRDRLGGRACCYRTCWTD